MTVRIILQMKDDVDGHLLEEAVAAAQTCSVAQYAGRLHRDYEGKQEVQIYDYIDIRVPVCESMYRKRLKGYASIGYRFRNNEMFDSLFPTTDIIYDGLNFEHPFITNLAHAKCSVVIACPKVKLGRHSLIAKQIVELATIWLQF